MMSEPPPTRLRARVRPRRAVKMSLLDNSLDFLREGLRRAVAAEHEHAQWKLAILCLCQAAELALKTRLQREHNALVYADLDRHCADPRRRRTVSFEAATHRLQTWCGVVTREWRAVRLVREWRNDIVHYEFEIDERQLKPKLASLLVFLEGFYRTHLDVQLSKKMGRQLWAEVLRLKAFVDELLKAARRRVKTESRGLNVETCEECGYDTRVDDGSSYYECYLCGSAGDMSRCPCCGEIKPDYEIDVESEQGWCWRCAGMDKYLDVAIDAVLDK